MGPILVIGVGAIALLWYLGLLTPTRMKWLGAATAALVGLRVLAMGRPLVAAALFALGGWLAWSAKAAEPLAEARRLLGVGRNATEAEIIAAWRARMAATHPDRGGSNAAASAINAARDRLLQHAARRGRRP
jgi:hypothetical protein